MLKVIHNYDKFVGLIWNDIKCYKVQAVKHDLNPKALAQPTHVTVLLKKQQKHNL